MKHCAIVRDLLPMYIEELTSEESTAFVREHLSQCDECRAEYERMTAPTPPPAPSKWGSWKDACQKEIKKQRRRTILLVLLCIALLWWGIAYVADYRSRFHAVHTVSTLLTPEEVLTLCPEVIPTREELDFLTWGADLPFLSDTNRVISEEEFAPYRDRLLPQEAVIRDICTNGHYLTIVYDIAGQRIWLNYRDEDEDGTFDALDKYFTPDIFAESPEPWYSAEYRTKTVTTQYEKHEEEAVYGS